MPISKRFNVFVRPGKSGLQVRIRNGASVHRCVMRSWTDHDIMHRWCANNLMFGMNVAVLS